MSLFRRLFGKERSNATDIHSLIKQLKKDSIQHEQVEHPLTAQQIKAFEKETGFQAPPSFSVFLRLFGDGAYWLYGCQPVDSTSNPSWLGDLRHNAPSMMPVDGGNPISKDSLFCLMTEDSNGGAWCWLTSERDADGECPLAYYGFVEKKLFYKVESFTRWLSLLVENREEVIRVLDTDDELCLG